MDIHTRSEKPLKCIIIIYHIDFFEDKVRDREDKKIGEGRPNA
jgi:hypothetical protein